jgi:hypothetical protein
MTFFIPNKSHQLLKIRAVYSGGAGVSEHPRNLGVQKREKFACYRFFRFQNCPISLAMRFLIASIQDENGGSSLTECENSLIVYLHDMYEF